MTTVKIYPGDCRKVLASIADESVHCVITSPPYYGLRDYKVEPSIWGGNPNCQHEWALDGAYRVTGNNSAIRGANDTGTFSAPKFEEDNARVRLVGGKEAKRDRPLPKAGAGRKDYTRHPDGRVNVESRTTKYKDDDKSEAPTVMGSFCQKCGAWRGALGLEPSVEMYIEHMVEIFGEIRRVLRKDGTLWLNMGDSYVSAPPGNKGKYNPETDKDGAYKRRGTRQLGHGEDMDAIYAKHRSNLKQKDLIGMPWRLALALQADGWWLRQDIIWHKPNPMPESTTDRCTKSHEYFFMLTRSQRYYYDQEAIAEPVAVTSVVRVSGSNFVNEQPGERDYSENSVNPGGGNNSIYRAMKNFARKKPLVGDGFVNVLQTDKAAETPRHDGERWNENNGRGFMPGASRAPSRSGNKVRKMRKDYGGDPEHGGNLAFAVPWEGWTRNKRSVWTVAVEPFPGSHFAVFPPALVRPAILAGCPQRCCSKCGAPMVRTTATSEGWVPTCKHDADMVPGVVMDPFGGSGTVAAEATLLDRSVVLIELSPEYVDMIVARLGRPGFLAPTVEIVKPHVERFIPSEQEQRRRRDNQATGG